MRLRFPALAVALTICLAFGAAGSARAQSFFQKLFGFGEPQQPQMRLGHPSGGHPASVETHRSLPRSWSDERPHSRRSSQSSEAGGGKVQTLCVRMCDGYYFPISRATSRRNLQLDAKACSARCGGEARLFILAEDTDDKSEMTDLTGLAYGELPNAFKYRKALTPGCACRPDPWSQAELERHRAYAAAEAEKNAGERPATVADAAPPANLPPAVSGPGVVIMSADETVVASADQGSSNANGVAPLEAPAGEETVASVPQAAPKIAGEGQDVAEAFTPPAIATAESSAAVAYVPRASKAGRHRAPRVAMLNAGAAQAQADRPQQRRRQHQRANPQVAPKAANYAVAGNGWGLGQAKYRYPGDPAR